MHAIARAEPGASPTLTELPAPKFWGRTSTPRPSRSGTNPIVATLDRIATDFAAGRITVPVSRTYTLTEVPAALDDFVAGILGKLAVTVA